MKRYAVCQYQFRCCCRNAFIKIVYFNVKDVEASFCWSLIIMSSLYESC